jgi:hypothetical protein
MDKRLLQGTCIISDLSAYINGKITIISTDSFQQAPKFERAIKAGKDVRYLWFALRAWRGEDPEGYFGKLGEWAERRLKDISAK